MNYELTNFNSIFSSYTGESRRIKLRKLSFTNVYNAWKAISDSVIPSIPEQSDTKDSDDIISEEETTTNDVNKINVEIDSLKDQIDFIETNYILANSIKRRVLAISQDMYENIIKKTNLSINQTDKNLNDSIDEDEIKQAVKDAFDQIEFDKPVNDDDIIITPEEVSNTVVSYDDPNQDDESSDNYGKDLSETKDVNSTELDNEKTSDFSIFDSFEDDNENYINEENKTEDEYKDGNPLFNFENINFDTIETDEEFNEPEYNSTDISSSNTDFELDDILSEAKELKAKKDEQDKKTEEAKNLADEKEKEKEKIKADFIAYKNDLEKELNESKQQEQESLERARKAEEFSTMLSNFMN